MEARNLDKFFRQMWWPFAEWVSSRYPKDAAVMYLHAPRGVARFSLESIRLWQKHTREHVEEVKQGTAQRTLDAESPFPEAVRRERPPPGGRGEPE